MTQKIFRLSVRPEEAGRRVDVFLRDRLARFSRTEIQRRIERGEVLFGTKPLRASRRVFAGDVVRLLTTVPDEPEFIPTPPPILYEDERVLAVDKPPDLPVHPCGGFGLRSVLTVLKQMRPGQFLAPAHRLDRETSGVLLFSKDPEADRALKKAFFEKRCQKEYLALVEGTPPEEEILIDLAIGPQGGKVRARWGPLPVSAGGFAAKTRVRVVKRLPRHARLLVLPETGRQHQIRVHLQAVGYPIVGDKLYGPSEDLYIEFARARGMTEHLWQVLGIARQALHARALSFPHPSDGRAVLVESPWPDELSAHEEKLAAPPK